jgi:hypothetical protein
MIELILGKVLDWPFLAFVLVVVFLRMFRSAVRDRIGSVREMTFGGSTKITLGVKEIDASNIGKELTDALRGLVQRVEALEGKVNAETRGADIKESASDEIPSGLKDLLWRSVFPMLNSDLWYARYVDTLAKNTSTSPELMERFLRSRPEVEVFQDGHRLAAGLKSRSRTAP